MMAGKIPIPEENVKFIVKDLTPERILRYIDVKDIISNLNDEDIKELRKLLNEKAFEDIKGQR